MDRITEYLLSITAAAIICVIIKTIVDKKTAVGNIISVVSGVFLLFTVLSPLLQGSLVEWGDYLDSVYVSGDDITAAAVDNANKEMKQIIKQQTETYIQKEADRLGLEVSIEADISDGIPPVPCTVNLYGNISPYNKQRLSSFIVNNFGISREYVQWKS